MKLAFRRNIHFYLTAFFGLMLVPACVLTRLKPEPMQSSTVGFVLAWAFQSLLCAALLYQFGVPAAWSSTRGGLFRLVPGLALVTLMIFLFGAKTGVEIAIVGVAIAEYQFRGGSWKRAAEAFLPFFYLALGIIIAVYFSSVVVTLRRCTEFDATLARIDSWLLFGSSVSHLSYASTALYRFAEPIYYGMGGLIGAALLFLCIAGERSSALRMAGAILTAYFLSLVIFFLVPAQGPFVAAGLPPELLTANIQHLSVWNATLLYHHAGWVDPPFAYYVAFPSLHVAQPLIAARFLRRWRGVFYLALAYCAFLVASIVILQWHYFVDILGGLGVSALAVWLVSPRSHALIAETESAAMPVR
jgi:hypothetical protein